MAPRRSLYLVGLALATISVGCDGDESAGGPTTATAGSGGAGGVGGVAGSGGSSVGGSSGGGGESAINNAGNFFGIAWRGTAEENLKFAAQMGYDAVFYRSAMEDDPNADSLAFYLESPEYHVYPVSRVLDSTAAHTAEEQALYEQYFAWKSTDPFPDNMATGYWWIADGPERFSVEPDFQQSQVIDYFVDRIIEYAKSRENPSVGFRCAGAAWDVPDLTGDFWSTDPRGRVTLAHWTGEDSSVLHPGITHEYDTYSDGRAEYYKRLRARMEQEFGSVRFIMEPTNIARDWISTIEDRSDATQLVGDIVTQEGPGTDFVDDADIFASGLITVDRVGCTTPNVGDHDGNLLLAASAAVNGAWFGWYGRFGGSGNMPSYDHVDEVPARLQLIRVLANWENLADTPLADRSWDTAEYRSPTARADGSVIYGHHPRSGNIFVVFLDTSGAVELAPNEQVSAVHTTDGFFIESGDGQTDLEVSGGEVRLLDDANVGRGYILETFGGDR